jgi:hypothetical protein
MGRRRDTDACAASAIAPIGPHLARASHFVACFSFFFFCFSLMLSFGLLFFFGVC